MRKTDRRSLYTQNAIKDALLTLAKTTPYMKISVAQVCREAEISRSTFYLHYGSMDDVLDAVIDDALLFSETGTGTIVDTLNVIGAGDTNRLENDRTILPACQRIADSDKYHDLFMDPTISEHIIHRIFNHEKGKVVPYYMRQAHLTEADAETLFKFILHGSFFINQSLGWQKDAHWYHVQEMLGKFINGGVKTL